MKDGLTAFASALWRLCLKGRERGFCDSELGAKKHAAAGAGKDGQEVLIHLSVCLCHVGGTTVSGQVFLGGVGWDVLMSVCALLGRSWKCWRLLFSLFCRGLIEEVEF